MCQDLRLATDFDHGASVMLRKRRIRCQLFLGLKHILVSRAINGLKLFHSVLIVSAFFIVKLITFLR